MFRNKMERSNHDLPILTCIASASTPNFLFSEDISINILIKPFLPPRRAAKLANQTIQFEIKPVAHQGLIPDSANHLPIQVGRLKKSTWSHPYPMRKWFIIRITYENGGGGEWFDEIF